MDQSNFWKEMIKRYKGEIKDLTQQLKDSQIENGVLQDKFLVEIEKEKKYIRVAIGFSDLYRTGKLTGLETAINIHKGIVSDG